MKTYNITIQSEDMLTIWDALYGRRSSEARGNQDELSKDKIAKYDRLMKQFDTDIINKGLVFRTRYSNINKGEL